MALRINDTAPDFSAETSQGSINFHEWIGDSWAVLFSHPKDFTPVCTTEFGSVAQLSDEWKKRNVKVIGVSVDSAEDHKKWADDIEKVGGAGVDFPIIGDTDLTVAKLYDMLPAEAYLPDGRTPADSATVRTVFVIDPDKKIKLQLIYPMNVGRNYQEILRAIDGLQTAASNGVSTPTDWQPGEKVVVPPALSLAEAQEKFDDVEEILPYLKKANLRSA